MLISLSIPIQDEPSYRHKGRGAIELSHYGTLVIKDPRVDSSKTSKQKMNSMALSSLLLRNPMVLSFFLADAVLLSPLYLVTIAMPRRTWLIMCTVIIQTFLLYKGLSPRGVPCGMSGNVLYIPEPQESFQAFSISMIVSSLIRLITLHLRDIGCPTYVRTILHVAGFCLLPFSFLLYRVVSGILPFPMCFE